MRWTCSMVTATLAAAGFAAALAPGVGGVGAASQNAREEPPPAAARPAALTGAEIPIHGRVLGPGGLPLSGAVVELLAEPHPHVAALAILEGEEAEPAAEAESQENGDFTVLAPEPGVWRVRVAAEGLAPRESLLAPLLEETHLPPVNLERDLGLEVRVLDTRGEPLSGARLATDIEPAGPFAAQPWRRPQQLRRADDQGRARLTRQQGERLGLLVAAEGHAAETRDRVAGERLTVALSAGVPRPLLVVAPPGRPLPQVVIGDRQGRPLVRTGEDGTAVLHARSNDRVPLRLIPGDGMAREVTLEPAREVPARLQRFTLSPAFAVPGRVVDLESRKPLPGALVWVMERPGMAARTGDDGTFLLHARRGALRLGAGATGYLTAIWQEATADSQGSEVTFALQRGVRLLGRVVDPEGRPVADAEVEVSVAPSPGGGATIIGRDGGQMPRLGRSGAEGRFTLPLVAPQTPHLVRIRKAGYAPARQDVPPLAAGERQELRITVARGRHARGLVVDGEDQPIAGATVSLEPQRAAVQRMSPMPRQREEVVEGESDSRGRFELADLPAGRFQLTVRAPGFAATLVPGIEVPAGAGLLDLGTVVLAPGAAIQGVVEDPEGTLLAGAEVFATEPSPLAGVFSFAPPGPAQATSGADGSFVVDDRGHGERVDLSVRLSGYAPGHLAQVAAPTEEPVRIVLEPASRLSGRVVDDEGRPVAEAEVHVVTAGEGAAFAFVGMVARASSDQEGHFAFEDLAPGTRRLTARAPGFLTAEPPPFELPAGAELEGLELVMVPGATLVGTVTGPSGAGVAGAEIALAEERGPGPRAGIGRPRARSDGDGRYRLDGVEPGRQTVEARHDRFPRAVRSVEVTRGEQRVDLVFSAGATVTGRVVAQDGAPVAGAALRLVSRGMSWMPPEATSGGDGSFGFEGVEDGAYTLRASREGFAAGSTEVVVDGEPVGGVEVRLPRGSSVVGRLLGLDFEELPEVQVSASAAGVGGQRGRVDFEGGYRIEGLAPGEWRVSGQVGASGRRASGRAVVEEGLDEVWLDLDFRGGATLSGRVQRQGQAASGALISLRGADVAGWYQGRTDHTGAFVLEGLHEGRYHLEVLDVTSGLRHSRTVEAPGEIEVELESQRISGRVVEAASGAGIPGATIVARPVVAEGERETPVTLSARSDDLGAFRFQGVEEGAWRLIAQKPGYASGEVTVAIYGGDFDAVEIPLEPGEGLILRVRLARGGFPSMVRVAVLDGAGQALMTSAYPTGEGGEVRLSTLPAGTWELQAQAEGSAVVSLQVTVPGEPVDVLLPEGAVLAVRVPELVEEATLAQLELTAADGRPFRGLGARSRFDVTYGRAVVGGLPAGTWIVTVTAPGGRSWSGTAAVAPGERSELELR